MLDVSGALIDEAFLREQCDVLGLNEAMTQARAWDPNG
jgi:hypothetical protein